MKKINISLKVIIIGFVIFIIAGVAAILVGQKNKVNNSYIKTLEDCSKAGGEITHRTPFGGPATCKLNGESFTVQGSPYE